MNLYHVTERFNNEKYLLLAPNDECALELADERLLGILKRLRTEDENRLQTIEMLKQDADLRKEKIRVKMITDDFNYEGIIAVAI